MRLAKTLVFFFFFFPLTAEAIQIVAAENMYGQIAEQLGGSFVQVTSILNNPNQDPHLFSSSPRTAKAVANADLIIYNGLDYDPWMINLISANQKSKEVIVIADLFQKKSGDNPHIWYDPKIMLKYAEVLTGRLSELDPQHKSNYEKQLQIFKTKYQALATRIETLKNRYQNTPILATEPVFNELAESLGLSIQGLGFQLSIMNGTEPSPEDIKHFQEKLNQHQVKVLIYNNQVSNPLTEHMQSQAKLANIPTVGVSETQPSHEDYFVWMNRQLDALEKALGGRS